MYRRHAYRKALIICLIFLCAACATQEIKPSPKPAKIALVLGAGASRGFAHIGVLKILESNKIPIHMIVGTSAGSIVGSLYSYGFNSFQLQEIALSINKTDIIDFTIPDNGFVKGEKLEEYINSLVRNSPIEKMRIPFYAIATDIQTGQEVVFGRGNTGTAVRASSSIPGIFRPVRIENKIYVDGGVVSPAAVEAARKHGADIVIAVDISADIGGKNPEGTIETILQSIGIMYSKLSASQLAKADIVVRPKVGHIGTADFDKRHEAIIEGEKAALESLNSIQNILIKLRQNGRLD